ncbi:MAG: 50S ribosomal protein L11 methyltransferase [Candidatus Woesearchaeota archaeon]
MLALKTKLKYAEKVKLFLKNNNYFDNSYKAKKEKEFIYYPIKKKTISDHEINSITELVNIKLYHNSKNTSKKLKDAMANKLSLQEHKFLRKSHDIIGTIAILEIPNELEKKEKIIAKTLLKINPRIKTVLKKNGEHQGVYRIQPMKYLAGIKTKEAVYKENNVIMKFDVEKVYFSIRLSEERKRISRLVKPGENILVMFSGCGPYCLILAKNTKASNVLGIEINPIAHKYGLENIKINKINNIKLINNDVKNEIENLKEKFDRIIMPLPKYAENFLDEALRVSKTGTIIHFYDFLHEKEFEKAIEKIDFACKKNNIQYKILRTVKCGQHSPRIYRICIDFVIV